LLFVGRLSVEKGVATLSQAMALLSDVALRVAGDGPEAPLLDGVAGVTCLGSLPSEVVRHEMGRAIALVVPSIWYETFGLVVIEAFACSTPVIVSRIGALAELVRDGETGLLFEPGDPRDLADKIAWAQTHPEQMAAMGCRARAQYEAEFSAEVNYRRLMEIYEGVLAGSPAAKQ
jgi:glycosyltransferase involved in cell wall biosynthesis